MASASAELGKNLSVAEQTSTSIVVGERVLPPYGSLLPTQGGRLVVPTLDNSELAKRLGRQTSESGSILVQAAYAIPAPVGQVREITGLVVPQSDVVVESAVEDMNENAKPALLDRRYRHILHPLRSRRAFASHLADVAVDAALHNDEEWAKASREKLLDHIDPQRIDQLVQIASEIGMLWEPNAATREKRQALLTQIQELRWDLRETNIKRAIRAPFILLIGIPLAVVGYEQANHPAYASAVPQIPEDPQSLEKVAAFLVATVGLLTISSQRNDSVARRVLAKFESDLLKGDSELVGRGQWQIGLRKTTANIKRIPANIKNSFIKLRNFAQTAI